MILYLSLCYMSLATLKKKSAVRNRSGKPPGGIWLPQGPFGSMQYNYGPEYGPEGFSINGSHRNVGYVGKDSKFSRNGTPFRGVNPMGSGGSGGRYVRAEPVLNAARAVTEGPQYLYVKPSVLSTYGMLAKKYRWIRSGQYPNYWVQPINTGNQVETSSQGMYIHTKTTANACVQDVNDEEKYVANIKCGECISNAKKIAPYTKSTKQAMTSSEHMMYIQRRCANPKGSQKPFPFAVQTGTGIIPAGTSVNNIGSACNLLPVYLSPPEWYLAE
jgi:hypothetical protein